MTGVSIDAVEVQGDQFLGAATIGETSILVASPVEDAPTSADVHYLLGKMFELAQERAEPAPSAGAKRALADGGETAAHTLTGNGSIPPGYEPTAADTEADGE